MEYEYSVAAKSYGIVIPETKLFPSKICKGYFGVKRFDRKMTCAGELERIHYASVSVLLETSHRVANLDYEILLRLTMKLTRSMLGVEKMFRLMCFNVLAKNRDDHSKNFVFIYNQYNQQWTLSPAYDLTFSSGMMGEHTTTVLGKGKNITKDDLLMCGVNIGMRQNDCSDIFDQVAEAVLTLKNWIK